MGLIRKLLRFTLKFAVAVLTLVLVLLTPLALLTFETEAQHQNPRHLSPESAQIAGQFLRRVSRQIMQTKNQVKISGKTTELNSLFQVISHNYPHLHAVADFKDSNAKLLLSLELFALGKKVYINTSANIEDSERGVKWSHLQIGKLSLPNRFANTFFSRMVEIMLGKRYGRGILNSIRDLEIHHNAFSLNFHPNQQFHQGLSSAINRLSTYSGHSINFDSERVQYYFDFLNDYASSLDGHKVSLGHILQVLLQETAKQSQAPELIADEENASALFALALNNANTTFRHFIAGFPQKNQHRKMRLTLAGREDLAKHFVYSVALKLLADSGLSLSIGETKEIHDIGRGGSGFSFADLAADKAGIKFAEVATSNVSAAQLQNFSESELHEADFFPTLDNLPEGIDHRQFQKEYVNTNSPKYKAILQDIDQRIANTKLHQYIER